MTGTPDARLSYAGVGLADAPSSIVEGARHRAALLAERGWSLRSGGRNGFESALEIGALEGGGEPTIILPFEGFNGHLDGISADRFGLYGRANRIAALVCPKWHSTRAAERREMAAVVFMLLGRNLRSPVRFLLCWGRPLRYTPEGGLADAPAHVGFAIRLANEHDIPVFCPDSHLTMLHFEDLITQAEQDEARRQSS